MPSDDRLEGLSKLKATAERSLRSFLRRTAFTTPAPGAPQNPDRRLASLESLPPLVASDASQVAHDAVVVNVNLMGGAVFLDDERRVRALAKEIKRLISEDQRRGIAV